MKQQTILVVEDDQMWCDILTRLFTEGGYKVLVAQTCCKAIETIRAKRPDCVVLDFNLSDGDCIPVSAEIRNCPGQRIPMILFSADPAAEEHMCEQIADKFFPKNTPIDGIFAEVRKLLVLNESAR